MMTRGIRLGQLAFVVLAVALGGACERRAEGVAVAALEAAGGASGSGPVCLALGKPCTGDPPCCPGLACVGTCVQNPSDRNMKRDFADVDRKAVLDKVASLPISTWSYKDEPNRPRHIGPMAQDFKQTFNVGADDKSIFQIDADGVAFAAIQALNAEVKLLTAENAALRREVAEIRAAIGKERPKK